MQGEVEGGGGGQWVETWWSSGKAHATSRAVQGGGGKQNRTENKNGEKRFAWQNRIEKKMVKNTSDGKTKQKTQW